MRKGMFKEKDFMKCQTGLNPESALEIYSEKI